jgi:hypothetical protein
MELKNGKYTEEQFQTLIHAELDAIQSQAPWSNLPAHADQDLLQQWFTKVRIEHFIKEREQYHKLQQANAAGNADKAV